MPDFERRSSASFISSKEGGMPDSLSRSWMKRSSSNCFRVSILGLVGAFWSVDRRLASNDSFETNHERTLYVRYLFRNPLIWGEQVEGPRKAVLNPRA